MPAPAGSPLSIAILGVEDLDRTTAFYRDLIGLDASQPIRWEGPAYEAHWQQPAGAGAEAVLLRSPASQVGRILLLQFNRPGQRIRSGDERRFNGLWNLNFYTFDIHGAARDLAARGYSFWSEPIKHDLASSTGQPTEVLFEGPDGVTINLVELPAGEGTRVGEMRRYLEQHGTTRTGFTEVVTSAHCVHSMARAMAFATQVLGQEAIIDEVIDKPESNRLLNLPADGRTHIAFMKGSHMFGKIALSQPLNYQVPDKAPLGVPPNIGYLAQSFEVPDLIAAEAAARALGAAIVSPAMTIDLPAIGPRQALLVRNPGSGALQQLVESVG